MFVFNIMCKLFFAIGLGYYLNKKGILTEDVNQHLSSFIIKIATPCLIISSVTSVSSIDQSFVIQLVIIGVAIYCMLPVIAYLLTTVFPCFQNKKNTYTCMFMFSNCGFMALPIVQSIFGNDAIFYNTILHLPYNILFFTLGSYLLSKDGETTFAFKPQQLLSAGVVSSLIAIILFFTHIQLPECISGSLSFVGSVVTPLSMLSIGVSIACYPIKEVITNKTLYIMSVLRLILIPIITYFLMHLFVNDPMIVQMTTITLGMPVGSMVAMGASEYHGDVKTASFGVALSTLLSLITIPVLLLLLA